MTKAKASCQVVLTLNKDEAETLMDVVGSVNGDTENSRRKHTDAIYEELERVGVAFIDECRGGVTYEDQIND